MLHRLIHTVAIGLFTLFCASSVLAAEQGTTVIYYHHDVRGDPIVVTTETGQIQWIESYRGYGQAEPRVSSEGIGLGDNAAENHASRLGYTGHQPDSGSSLTYMQQRHYDPVIGRFMSNDPVGFTTSNTMMFNRYAYANNNPYAFKDPDGRYPTDYTAENESDFGQGPIFSAIEGGVMPGSAHDAKVLEKLPLGYGAKHWNQENLF